MISLEEALQKIDRAISPLPPRKVAPLEAIGCCIAEEIAAGDDIPNFASSAMDGIAVCLKELENGSFPIELNVQGTIAAGKPAEEPIKPGYAYRIMTGAPLPAGADTVIKVEEVEFDGGRVKIARASAIGQHVRPIGNDIKKGELVFPVGYRLKPIDAGICAGLGLTEISVYPRPRIALLATGSEIQSPGSRLKPGQIYNANDTSLRASIIAFGLPDPGAFPSLRDDPEELTPTLSRLCREYDVVITSGAVSAGQFDYIPDVVKRLNGELLFHKVFVKPGKPTLIAKIGECWLLSLPGNPVSVVVTFHLYGKRLLARLMGRQYQPVKEHATLAAPFGVSGDRFQVVGAYLKRTEQGLSATAVERYSSGRLSSIKGIDGFILVPGGTRQIEAGTVVEVEWL